MQRNNNGLVVMKLFDAHCHLQLQEPVDMVPKIVQNALDSGVVYMVVNGVQEQDWLQVNDYANSYPSIIPSFGLHPWYLEGRTSAWFDTLKENLNATPCAAVGEIGLDNSPFAPKNVEFNDQIEVFRKQLELAKHLNRPVSVHCLAAFDQLFALTRSIGPFPAGIIMHSYAGTAEMVPELADLGAYFSFSGHLMSREIGDASRMLKTVPLDRLLLETDSPSGLPICKRVGEKTDFPEGAPNQPAYIHLVLSYVASMLDMSEEEVGRISYENAINVFSFEGSKLLL